MLLDVGEILVHKRQSIQDLILRLSEVLSTQNVLRKILRHRLPFHKLDLHVKQQIQTDAVSND